MGLRNHKDSSVGAMKEKAKGSTAVKKRVKRIKKAKPNKALNPGAGVKGHRGAG